MNKKRKTSIVIIAIILGLIVLRFLFNAVSQGTMKLMMSKKSAPAVLVTKVAEAEVIKEIKVPCRVESILHIDILARIEGYLTKSYFEEGEFVKKGQIIFEIEPEQYALAVKRAQATVNATKADLVYAEKQLVRASELVKKDYIAKSAYDETLARRDSLKAQLSMNLAALSDAQRNYGYTKVKSPVNGKISLIRIPVGNYVTPTTGVITTVNSTDPIYVEFSLDTEDYQQFVKADGPDAKRKVEFYFSDNTKYPHQGVQDFTDNSVEMTTGTVKLRATFDNPDGVLIHGDFGRINLFSNTPVSVPVVPQEAVLENPQGKYVYKLDEKNLPQIQIIQVGKQDGQNWVVNSGLQVGDRIISEGLQKVVPSMPIREITEAEMKQIKAGETAKKEETKK